MGGDVKHDKNQKNGTGEQNVFFKTGAPGAFDKYVLKLYVFVTV